MKIDNLQLSNLVHEAPIYPFCSSIISNKGHRPIAIVPIALQGKLTGLQYQDI